MIAGVVTAGGVLFFAPATPGTPAPGPVIAAGAGDAIPGGAPGSPPIPGGPGNPPLEPPAFGPVPPPNNVTAVPSKPPRPLLPADASVGAEPGNPGLPKPEAGWPSSRSASFIADSFLLSRAFCNCSFRAS